jgi:hypothetical protein
MTKSYLLAIPFAFAVLTSCDSISDKITEKATEAVLESLSSDSVDINLNTEDGEVSLTINTEDGTTTLDISKSELPEDFPTDIYLIPDAKRGVVSVVDSPDGKFIALVDTLNMSVADAQAEIKSNMTGYELKFETISDINATLMYESESVKSFTISLNEFEGRVLANYAVMY